MSKESVEAWTLVAQAVASLATVGSLIFLYFQLRVMRGQLQTTNVNVESQRRQLEKQTVAAVRSSQGANVFQLLEYLEQPRHLEARAVVRTLAGKDLDDWTDDERAAADLAARLWTHAAIIQKLGILPDHFLHYYYGGAISRSWRILKPHVEQLRARSDPTQRQEFETVALEVDRLGWFVGGDNRPADRYDYLTGFSSPTS